VLPTPEGDLEAAAAEAARALLADDADGLRRLLRQHPALAGRLQQPTGPFDSPAILHVRSRAALDALLDAGVDVNGRSRWWAGGFGLLDCVSPDLAVYAIERGAVVDPHAAARLGLIDRLRELLHRDPELVRARGGDGQTPLHCASNIEIAALLVGHGADIDALDVDHESTPAQYMVRDRQDVARFLIAQGARTDLLMAAALGDVALIERHLAADPGAIRLRVDDENFPRLNPRAGGTIYQWALGFHQSPHRVAGEFGHSEALRRLLDRSPVDVKLIEFCWAGDELAARTMRAAHPGIIADLSGADRRQVAHAARNNATAAVALMLDCGWPADAKGQHGGTPLHWAAFHGNVRMTQAVLACGPPLHVTDADFHGMPVDWAIYGSAHGWHAGTGDFAATIRVLLEAGARAPSSVAGSAAVQDVLRQFGVPDPA
jgi:ankyrin repeat protein